MTKRFTEVECSCWPKASADGQCTEWSCMYHGRENEKLQREQRANCRLHGRSHR